MMHRTLLIPSLEDTTVAATFGRFAISSTLSTTSCKISTLTLSCGKSNYVLVIGTVKFFSSVTWGATTMSCFLRCFYHFCRSGYFWSRSSTTTSDRWSVDGYMPLYPWRHLLCHFIHHKLVGISWMGVPIYIIHDLLTL